MKNVNVRTARKGAHVTRGRRGARLGQHFLTRPEIAGWVAESLAISASDTVLEIGPGHGILTRELLRRAGKVVAVEKDASLADELRGTFTEDIASGKLAIIEGDIRSFEPSECALLRPHYTLCANIPYYITGLIIRKFLTAEHQPRNMALLVQKEVAERVMAKDGKESLLSLSVKAYGTPELVRTVKAGSFSPPPNVDSAILAIRNITRQHFANRQAEQRFFDMLHTAFSQKRKTIGSTLKHISDDVFVKNGLSRKERPENVSLGRWLILAGTLART